MQSNIYTVWIEPKAKIASFHYETGFQRMKFYRKEEFMTYLVTLSDERFRFQ